jgi:hypothetical protein
MLAGRPTADDWQAPAVQPSVQAGRSHPMFRPGEGAFELFQKIKEEQFGFQFSVRSGQFSVSHQRGKDDNFIARRLSSVVSPTKLARRPSSHHYRAGRPGAEAIFAKINLLSTRQGRVRCALRAGVDGFVNRGQASGKRLMGFAGAQLSLRNIFFRISASNNSRPSVSFDKISIGSNSPVNIIPSTVFNQRPFSRKNPFREITIAIALFRCLSSVISSISSHLINPPRKLK